MDYLTIDHLVVLGVHGQYDHERTREQSFHVSLRVGTHLKRAGQSDTLADTIDYDLLKRIVEETFAHETRYLVESLAETIAARILRETPALEATVAIKKPEAWDNGIPGVAITRRA
ncbi:MAG: diguanylate cyclase [Parcubacteria group bacterium]|nr:diguanylate cyclase [Parcubacteria group bacterium]